MTKTGTFASLPRTLLILLALFVLALVPRLYSAQTLGWNWDYPGSFALVNFDEGGSCRAALEGFGYTTFIGRQTIAITSALGKAPAAATTGDQSAAKAYCHSPEHLLVARSYSAVTGALTVVLTALLGLMLVPKIPAVGFTAGALLAFSGFHISASHSGTVDAPSVFFIYLFITWMVFAIVRGSKAGYSISPVFLVAAVWTKYWVFAVLAYLACLPRSIWDYVTAGLGRGRIIVLVVATAMLFGLMSIGEFRDRVHYAVFALWYLLVPWRRIPRAMWIVWLLVPLSVIAICHIDTVTRYTLGSETGRFGTSYGAIGWHKWLRNVFNIPMLLLVGLGLPAFALLPLGLRALFRGEGEVRAWCVLLPLLAFLLYMAFVSPITYYRHYLPLLPVAAILAAWGLYVAFPGRRRWAVLVFLAWPILLAVDLVGDYHRDPRIALRQWYGEHEGAAVYVSYYVNPPAGRNMLFAPEYAAGDASELRRADYLVLSENWYDTAYANELNGPLVHDSKRMIKTRPEYVDFYRRAIAGQHPLLRPEKVIALSSFMPELILHRRVYGNFQLFVGDIRVFRVIR